MRKEEFYREAVPGSNGPLERLRVLEATTAQAGPIVGTVLADFGAEVIKIEQPGTGNPGRRTHPLFQDGSPLENSTYFLSINRNKKNITLDLRHSEGREVFLELASLMDVVVENFKPGTMDKWGLGYNEVRRLKPDIIYTSISGFGQFGPYSPRPGYDPVGQAMGGIMHVTGYPDGPPTRTGNAMADNSTGWHGAMATLAALYHRHQTGDGQHVDVCLLDTMLYATDFGIMAKANLGFDWKRMGSGSPVASPADNYSCKDGYVFIIVSLDSHWARFCRLIGREDLIEDPRTRTHTDRAQQKPILDELVRTWTSERTVQQVVDAFEEAGLVCAPVYDFGRILQDPHIREREMVTEVEHPVHGRLSLYGVGPKFSRTPARVRTATSLLGQYNDYVYGEILEYSQEKRFQLRESGII